MVHRIGMNALLWLMAYSFTSASSADFIIQREGASNALLQLDSGGNLSLPNGGIVRPQALQSTLAPDGSGDFVVARSDGVYLLRLDSDTGDLYLDGTLFENMHGVEDNYEYLCPLGQFNPEGGNNFIFQDPSGKVLGWVDQSGNMAIGGNFDDKNKAIGANNFKIRIWDTATNKDNDVTIRFWRFKEMSGEYDRIEVRQNPFIEFNEFEPGQEGRAIDWGSACTMIQIVNHSGGTLEYGLLAQYMDKGTPIQVLKGAIFDSGDDDIDFVVYPGSDLCAADPNFCGNTSPISLFVGESNRHTVHFTGGLADIDYGGGVPASWRNCHTCKDFSQ